MKQSKKNINIPKKCIQGEKKNQNEKWYKKPTSQIMKLNHQEKSQTPTCKMQKRGGNKSYKHKGLGLINNTKCKGKAHVHCEGTCT
jgi:hypothetical protein